MVVHATSTITKKESMSKEEFDKYWSEHHGQVFMANPVAQKNLIRYSQHHIDAKQSTALAQKQGSEGDVGCDGMAHFWAESLDKLMEVFESEYYKTVVVPDEAKFLDREKITMLIGEDDDKWDHGKAGSHVRI